MPFPGVAERFERCAEQLEVITGLWRTPEGETFSYTGKHYRVTDSPALPKPAQRPHPPVLIGGKGTRRTPALAARFADEFNVSLKDMETTRAQYQRVRAACRDAGRDPDELTFSAAQTVCVGASDAEYARRAAAIGRRPDDLRADAIAGTVGEVVDRIGQWSERTGAQRLYLQFLDLTDLDHLALIASAVVPQLG